MVLKNYISLFSIFAFLFVFVACEDADQGEDDPIEESTVRYPSKLIEYFPAPGQFINGSYGLPKDAEGLVGKMGFVTLGSWGGYVVVGFDKAITNDDNNAYGVDFSIMGNAYENNSEPGIVMVMKDENANGLADDTWYELKSELYDEPTTIHNYTVTYYHTNDSVINWKDNQGVEGVITQNSHHTQDYYPLEENFSDINQDSISFTGTKLESKAYRKTTGEWTNPSYGYGYADNSAFNYNYALNIPDDPYTEEVEGSGGNAFDISWAIDTNGEAVVLDEIHFVKIYNAVMDSDANLGEVSTEIRAIVPVK